MEYAIETDQFRCGRHELGRDPRRDRHAKCPRAFRVKLQQCLPRPRRQNAQRKRRRGTRHRAARPSTGAVAPANEPSRRGEYRSSRMIGARRNLHTTYASAPNRRQLYLQRWQYRRQAYAEQGWHVPAPVDPNIQGLLPHLRGDRQKHEYEAHPPESEEP